MTGELDAALESLERFIERQFPAFEALHESLELGKRLFEVGILGIGGHARRARYTAGPNRVNAG